MATKFTSFTQIALLNEKKARAAHDDGQQRRDRNIPKEDWDAFEAIMNRFVGERAITAATEGRIRAAFQKIKDAKPPSTSGPLCTHCTENRKDSCEMRWDGIKFAPTWNVKCKNTWMLSTKISSDSKQTQRSRHGSGSQRQAL
eukprot:TRINITY_DN11797_c0_g1_i1.p6 TRINITY_DN11797_c0_g1~~TRINITY_DN11797_c0_g1_i1.p6  ORF type:complete len:143 (+),score=8.53 TRINITY_DN11797_c0_g1_i1:3784-4212(+)